MAHNIPIVGEFPPISPMGDEDPHQVEPEPGGRSASSARARAWGIQSE